MNNDESKSDYKQNAFGTCAYEQTQPPREQITDLTKIVNIHLSFEEALKLNLAIDECVRELNRYKRSKKAGKRASLLVAVHLNQSRISIHEGKLP